MQKGTYMNLNKGDRPINEITVMCDYSADGIWINGVAADLEIIAEDLDMEYDDKLKQLQKKLDDWQYRYEQFDFWSDRADTKKIYATPEFKQFLQIGEEIAYEIRELMPEDISVIYFHEGSPNARYIVNNDKTMTLKEKYSE
jgi:hypothetical protein